MKETNARVVGMPGSVFVFLSAIAVFLALHFAGLKESFEPLVYVPMSVGMVGLFILFFGEKDWHAKWRMIVYVSSVALFVEMALSLWVVDIGGYGSNLISDSFRAARTLKTPSGPVERVFSDSFGLALRSCPFCADEPVVRPKALYGKTSLDFAGAPKDACVWGRVSPKKDLGAMIGLFLNAIDPQRAMEMAALGRMRQCADRYDQWLGKEVVVQLECPTEDLPFVLDHVAVGSCARRK